MPVQEDQLRLADTLKEALLKSYDLDAVILFGSLGRGDGDEFSDVDLFLVMETGREADDLSKEMIGHLSHLTRDIHIIIRSPREYHRQCDIPGTIVYSADKEGRILFDKKKWRENDLPLESYEVRKKEVIAQEYIGSSYDFLTKARSSLHEGNLFRCRDFVRFAAVRAIKGLFVRHDIHPPRELNLVKLYKGASALEPDMMDKGFRWIDELHNYFPGDAGIVEIQRLTGLIEKTENCIKEIIERYQY
jgi:predicted nucleotidyltransferase